MSKELKIGLISLAIIILGIWGFNFLKGESFFTGSSREFKVRYHNTAGLSKASIVTINGFKVGKVTNIEFDNSDAHKGDLIVSFNVKSDFDFSKNSLARVYSPNPLSGANLAIVPDYSGETAVSGDYLKGEVEANLLSSIGEQLTPTQKKLDRVLNSVDTLLVSLNKVIDNKAAKSLNNTALELEKSMVDVRKMLKSVNSVIDVNKSSLQVTLANTNKISENLANVSKDLSENKIGNTVKKLDYTLANVNAMLSKVNKGQGSLGKLMTDDKMYKNLTNASKELEELLREMKLNPKRFVHFSLFGKKAKPYKPSSKL